eukprot:gene17854-biopygen17365
MVHVSSTQNVGVALRQRGTPTGDRPLRACSPPSGLGRAGWAGGWGWWGAGTHRMRSSQWAPFHVLQATGATSFRSKREVLCRSCAWVTLFYERATVVHFVLRKSRL